MDALHSLSAGEGVNLSDHYRNAVFQTDSLSSRSNVAAWQTRNSYPFPAVSECNRPVFLTGFVFFWYTPRA